MPTVPGIAWPPSAKLTSVLYDCFDVFDLFILLVILTSAASLVIKF